MAGAIGAALCRLDAAIGEFLTCRVADRPAARAFADFLEPDLQHLADLGLGEGPCRFPLARDGGDSGPFPQRSAGAAIAGRRGRSALGREARGAKQWMLPVSLTPIRFALPITALREGAPSATAMLLALFLQAPFALEFSIAASVHISPSSVASMVVQLGEKYRFPWVPGPMGG